ncbi:MAG: HAMP domain-containing histidine kinase [Granulosicoccus sp.]|nr:HAMP domain-containing histidine kinase [Granulosicoccus sp.]
MTISKLFSINSLTRTLTLYYALAFSLFLGATFLVLYLAIGATLNSRMDEDLDEDVEEFARYLAVSGVQALKTEMDKEASGGEEETVLIQLFDRSGSIVHSTDVEAWAGFTADQALLAGRYENPAAVELQTLEVPNQESETRVIYGALSPDYVLVIGESHHERDEVMELLAIAFSVVFILALPLATLLVLLLTRRSIAGIKSVSRAANDIKAGNLDRRVNASGQVLEVQTLADTFDAMASRIQILIRDMREMTDNIAHDLRSPLGRVRLLAESIEKAPSTDEFGRQAAADTIAECDRLIRMINLSLDVAETEAGVGGAQRVTVNMTELVEDACELFEAVAEQKNLELSKQLKNSLWIFGDFNSLQRMVANILDNAIKFTSSGGEVAVTLYNRDDKLVLIIRDTGIGIDEENLEGVFNRFFRVDPSRTSSGCGLGLSYSRAVARAHGGDITVQSGAGKYSEFRIVMPLQLDEQAVLLDLVTTSLPINQPKSPNDHTGMRAR